MLTFRLINILRKKGIMQINILSSAQTPLKWFPWASKCVTDFIQNAICWHKPPIFCTILNYKFQGSMVCIEETNTFLHCEISNY